MRERHFVEQNKDKWERFEAFANGKVQPEPDELSELYAHITDDLSYARTYYGRRSVRVYLNNLSQKVYLRLHKRRGEGGHPFVTFWTHDLPLALYRARKELNISLLFFVLSMAIGVLSSVHDPDFAKVILGENYISMTEANIQKGEPMGVYKSSDEIDMFLAITLNNLLVAFRTYVFGAFFGIGALVIMLYNGIMVGTFQYFFVERMLFTESFLTIWMHGALEISALVISGAAGLTLGRGLLYPGTLPRLQSFQIGARHSIKIMLGLVPIFIAAAFIEGFFTRITEINDFVRGSFIFSCFAFVAFYFWWYPRALFRGSDADEMRKEELISTIDVEVELSSIRKTKEVFTDSFLLFRKLFLPVLGCALVVGLVYTFAFKFIYGSEGIERINFSKFTFENLHQFHSYSTFYWNFFLNIFLIGTVCWLALYVFRKKFTPDFELNIRLEIRQLLKILVIVTLFELCILSGNFIVASLGILFIPYLALFMVVANLENLSLPNAFGRMLALLNGTRRHLFVTFLMLGIISVMFLLLVDSPFTWFYLDVLQWNIDAEEDTKIQIAYLSLVFINQLGLAFVLPLTLFGQILEYYSALETKEAKVLAGAVAEIGLKKSAYGLERE